MLQLFQKSVKIPICIEPGFEDLPLPHYQTPGSAGMDLYAAIDTDVSLQPGKFKMVSSGIRIALPQGYEAQIRPRSGLALKHGISIVNTPGTIDSDYRGIVGIILINFGEDSYTIKRGERIAQMVIHKYDKIQFCQLTQLPESKRKTGGFGSTGK